MKNLIITIAVGFTFLINNAFASFPVAKKEVTTTQQSTSAQIESKNNAETSKPIIEKKASKISKLLKKDGTKGDEKELIILLALWFFLGGFAAHRWYKGKPAGYNILFILTLGGCGIWALIDLINILTGKF